MKRRTLTLVGVGGAIVGLVAIVAQGVYRATDAPTYDDMLSGFTEPRRQPLSAAVYNRVRTGMTYDEVVSVLGPPHQELSRAAIAGTVSVMYQWTGAGGANMNAMFQDGRLVTKAQFGLE